MRKLAVGPFHALGRYVSREFWTTFCALRDYGWHLLEREALPHHGDDLEPLLRARMGGWPEVVLFWESYPQAFRYGRAFQEEGARVYVLIDDLHHNLACKDEALQNADGVLATYAPRIHDYIPGLDPARVTWVPHAAGPDFLLPPNDAPRAIVFVSGAMHEAYPLRLAMRDLAARRADLATYQPHPGYRFEYDYERDARVGRRFAEAMRGCLAAFTDALVHRYLVAKHFEIPATGALLLAERAVAPQLAELGLVDGEHYVGVSGDDLEATIEELLHPRNAARIDGIRRRGQALVHARHTTAHRTRQIDEVCV